MGRIRVRDGLLVMGEPGARKQRIAEHAKHVPNPNKMAVATQVWDGTLFPAPELTTSPAMKAMDERRLIILAEARKQESLHVLPLNFQKQLISPIAGALRPIEEAALSEKLDTIEFMMLRFQARARCEILRLRLQEVVLEDGPLARLILAEIRYDIYDETPRTLRPISCDERSVHYEEVISKFLPK